MRYSTNNVAARGMLPVHLVKVCFNYDIVYVAGRVKQTRTNTNTYHQAHTEQFSNRTDLWFGW